MEVVFNLLFFFLMCLSPVNAQVQSHVCKSPEKTGWELENLRGKTKILRVEEIHYDYEKPKRELEKQVTFDSHGNYTRMVWHFGPDIDYRTLPKPIFVFDSNCRQLERKGVAGEWGMTKTTYAYTESGKLKEEIIYDLQNRLLWKAVSIFDKNDRVAETDKTIQVHPEHFKPLRYDVYRDTKSFYKYDDGGNLIEQVDYKYDGTLYATYVRAYDDDNRVVRLTRFDGQGRNIDQSIYEFDNNGILHQEYKYNSSTYIGFGDTANLEPATIDSGFGMFQVGTKIIYEYDKWNNWIKRTEYDVLQENKKTSFKLQMTTFRTITYF